jgi:nitrite reductase (NO-forming)
MSIRFSRSVRNAGLFSASVMALCLLANTGFAAETIKAVVTTAPNVPPPITRTQPAHVIVDLEASEWVGHLSDDNDYRFWGFSSPGTPGTVPGPMIRVMVGDTVEIHLKNRKDSKESHNIDFHAVTGPGGGAAMLNTEPGEETKLKFKALNAGLYYYHCATSSPSIPEHIANGMYGGILVEPVGGLKKVDKEFYVVQSEFYTKAGTGKKGEVLEFSMENGLAEHPSHVVFNGMAGALVKNPLTAKVGDTVRMFYLNAGPNLVASWHVIGEIFDRVYPEGSIVTAPLQNLQTTVVPAGGSSMAEFKVEFPGTYINVDHSIFRIAKGAVGLLKVEGTADKSIYEGLK